MNRSPRVRLGPCRDLSQTRVPAWFSEPERLRWEALGGARRRPFLGSRILMRGILCDELGGEQHDWPLDARGHPLVCSPQVQTSLSHYQDRAAAAVCAHAGGLGIDLERRHRRCRWQDIARRWFAPTEQALLEACGTQEGERLFYRLWTLKEAWVKATGRGLAGHFEAIRLVDAGPHWRLVADTDQLDWQAWTGWVGADCLAVVWQGNPGFHPRIETALMDCTAGCSDIRAATVEDALQIPIGQLDQAPSLEQATP